MSLIVQYKLDDGSGTTVVDSVGAQNGTIDGSSTWSSTVASVPDGSTYSIQIASSSHIDLPAVLTVGPTSSFSIACWVRTPSAFAARAAAVAISIFSGDFEALIGADFATPTKWGLNVGHAYLSYQNVVASSSYSVDTWYHLCGVFRNGSAEFYVDGVSQGTVTYNSDTLSAAVNSNDWSIGSEKDLSASNDYAYPFTGGLIDEVLIYNHELSLSEVQTLAGVGAALTASLTASTTSIAENGGTAALIASLSATASDTVTVVVSTSGTATSDSDYSLSTTTITIASGQTSGSVSVVSINDGVYEGDETFTASITSVSGGGVSSSTNSQAVFTIVDDETGVPKVSISASTTTIYENSGDGPISSSIFAILSETASTSVTVGLAFGGTAVSGSIVSDDYSTSGTSISIPSGQTSGTISIRTTVGSVVIDEPDQTVIVSIGSISGGGASASSVSATTITIVDNSATVAPRLVISTPATMTESVGTPVVVPISLNRLTEFGDVTFSFSFSGTAIKDTDYSVSTTSFTIPVGSSTTSFSITALNDAVYEGNETISMGVSSSTNLASPPILSGGGPITFVDDETAPTINLSASTTSIVEPSGSATILVQQQFTTAVDTTVPLTFSGSATFGSDYTRTTDSVTISSGQTSASISVTALADSAAEAVETITVALGSITNGTAGATSSISINLTSVPVCSLTSSTTSIVEATGSAVVFAQLTNPWVNDVTVVVAFAGSATLNTDYSRSTNSVVILAGQTSASLSVTSIQDTTSEANETIIMSIGSVSGGASSSSNTLTIAIVDDDPRAGSGLLGLKGLSGLSGII